MTVELWNCGSQLGKDHFRQRLNFRKRHLWRRDEQFGRGIQLRYNSGSIYAPGNVEDSYAPARRSSR